MGNQQQNETECPNKTKGPSNVNDEDARSDMGDSEKLLSFVFDDEGVKKPN